MALDPFLGLQWLNCYFCRWKPRWLLVVILKTTNTRNFSIIVLEANVIFVFHIILGHWTHFWDLYGWHVIFAAEIQDDCQWPYWKLPIPVILVLFISKANRWCWIYSRCLYCSRDIYSANHLKIIKLAVNIVYKISTSHTMTESKMNVWLHYL